MLTIEKDVRDGSKRGRVEVSDISGEEQTQDKQNPSQGALFHLFVAVVVFQKTQTASRDRSRNFWISLDISGNFWIITEHSRQFCTTDQQIIN